MGVGVCVGVMSCVYVLLVCVGVCVGRCVGLYACMCVYIAFKSKADNTELASMAKVGVGVGTV